MPTRADIAAATPKCPHRKDRTTTSFDCGRLLTWLHPHEVWRCPVHGDVVTGWELVAVQTFEAEHTHA